MLLHVALSLCLFSVLATNEIPDLAADIGQRVTNQLKHLATFSDDPNPAVTRLLWTENDLKARDYVKSLMSAAGLTITEDFLGTIYGTMDGVDNDAPSIASGSHIDAIPLAGMYDGTTGVLGAIEALRLLKESGYKPHVPLQAVMFTSEEPTRFGLSCLGSRAMAGTLTADTIAHLHDVNGSTILQSAIQAGCVPTTATLEDLLHNARRTHKDIGGFVELHIEQGPELEQEDVQIGIVTAIAAPAQLQVTFHGDGGHAGAHLMHRRNDASLAASELALFVEQAALGTRVQDTVATTGKWVVEPNAVNSVPRDVSLDIDIRDIDVDRRDEVLDSIVNTVESIAVKRKVRYGIDVVSRDPPATCDGMVLDEIESVVKGLGYRYKRMVSRAYHDSLFMAQIAPTAMIFIPCQGGKSHRPDEYASPEDIGRGILVLAETMKRLSSTGSGLLGGGGYNRGGADRAEL